ncbi:hypothetical protein B7494_g154 [Chlorociboria aeruginascens]|nr:hypothetical protein B7494_g154 [Chlorociboria aeruginascens]
MAGRDNSSQDLKGPEASGTISTPTSPTDNRHPLSRFEAITSQDDGLSESFQSTDTIRRRPEPITYGSISTPQSAVEHRNSESSQVSDRPQQHSLESSRILQPTAKSPTVGPERGRGNQKTKKPTLSRRASSNVQAPYRGQEFSVDDDVNEIEDGMITRQAPAGSLFGTVRHLPTTMRRRPVGQQMPSLSRVNSSREEETEAEGNAGSATPTKIIEEDEEDEEHVEDSGHEDTLRGLDDATPDEEEDLSDAESFTLKDRQEAINETHPFGIRIWKPALYKKNRSVQKTAEGDIHSSPGGRVSKWLLFFNLLWTVFFGWWLSTIALAGAIVCFAFGAAPSAIEYGRVLWGLSTYLFYPFGKFVRLEQDEAYAEEDEGEGRSITEYEQWQSGDIEDGRLFFGPQGSRSIVGRSRRSMESFASETDSLLGRSRHRVQAEQSDRPFKRRLFGRGQWNTGRVIFFLFFYGLITPSLFVVSTICWFLVFWIPMGKVTLLLIYHLRRHPLALSFQSDTDYSRGASLPHSSIIVCTYRAVGSKYWKYTIDGTNIFLINLMAVVLFVILDYFVLLPYLELHTLITHPAFLFVAALFSIIPLAYFIGQAVASISAQSSMGLGAAINAFFSTLVEVFLYCVALKQGKGQLVEGSIIGSIFAGILFLPGLSMCFGAIKRKTQRFNAKSAGVTSTMLLFAVIAAFGPTLFYQIYGTHELNCLSCDDSGGAQGTRDCRRCYFSQVPALDDRFYLEAVRPYCWFAAFLLFLSYIIGLWFTLRTHAAVIWNNEVDEKKLQDSQHISGSQPFGGAPHGRLQKQPTLTQSEATRSADLRDNQLYNRILGQTLKQTGLGQGEDYSRNNSSSEPGGANGSVQTPITPHMVPPKSSGGESIRSEVHIPGFTDAQNTSLLREFTEIAATTATIAARETVRGPRKASIAATIPRSHKAPTLRTGVVRTDIDDGGAATEAAPGGGHDAPNWSRTKSSVILCGATLLYAMIAEILVDTVDVVLVNVSIDEKFLGITLFALVPNTTEFLNAISFAMNGNIALSMEIGSAYALQVCLLQIPALVLFSAINGQWLSGPDLVDRTFSLIFPQWDMVTVILCVFLLSYMYGEGKKKLDFKIVEDIAQEGAFDEAVKIEGLEAVIHTASPFHFNITDIKKDLIDPAVIGTTGILKAIKKNAPSVKHVVITSSFASIINPAKGNSWTEHTYSEADWNPITVEEALLNPTNGYRASKTFAEKAAWEFLEKEKPNFTLSTMCPPLVFGPIVHYLNSLDALNTSNQRIRNLITGQYKNEIADTGTFIWTDVRDLALAHVKAIEVPEAAGKRFFVTAGYFSNKQISDIIREKFPALEKELPARDVKGGDYPPQGVYKYDNSRVRDVLGIKFTALEQCIVDTVKSLQEVGA